MVRKMKKGQISLEFLFIFILFLVLLTFSIRNITFSSEHSADMLRIQVSEEAKLFANTVSNAISQVYAQGPGAKTTEYFTFRYLNDEYFLTRAFGMDGTPQILVGYKNGTYVAILDNANQTINVNETETTKKNYFWSRSLYAKDLSNNTSIYYPNNTIGNHTGIFVNATDLPSTLRIVVEWNPDRNESWIFNSTSGELRINLNVGG
ncbi:class III signal peptide-containing protein [Thermococcus sp. MV5]|uniref:class III signal peptide-containing protein n=1 Tax=Thermococcus sp. MV5 TaxID=1638272 RepID=UPI00143B70F4|nr:class III signal peptide-containing protein [Thermococcus sp. MV5]NJE25917.1 class III signal peptide-containing protein [Thermococcus sp. MV5]